MGDQTVERIGKARAAGWTDEQIAEKFKTKLLGQGVEVSRVNDFLSSHGLPTGEISAVTGEPVPTAAEKFQGGSDAAKLLMTTAGDVAGTALAPQLKGAQAAGKLARLGMGALNLGSRAVGAGVGSAAGNIAGQAIGDHPIDPREAAGQGAVGTVGELGIGVVASALKPLRKPFLELASDVTFLGNATKKRLRDKLVKSTTDRAETFIREAAPDIVKTQQVDINDLGLMVDAALDESRVAYGAYEGALDEVAKKEGGVVLMDDTIQFLGDMKSKFAGASPKAVDNLVVKELGFAPGSPEAIELKRVMAGDGSMDPKSVKYLMARVFGKFDKLPPSQQGLREDLKAAFKSDLSKMDAPDGNVADLKTQADEQFKAVKQYSYLKRLFDGAMREVPETGEKRLQPKKLAKDIYANQKRIENDFPDLWPKIKAEADFYNKIAPEFEKSGLDVGPASVFSRGLGGTAAAMAMGPAGIPVAESFGVFSAWALMSDKGRTALKVLTQGVVKPTVKAGLHLGGEQVLMPAH